MNEQEKRNTVVKWIIDLIKCGFSEKTIKGLFNKTQHELISNIYQEYEIRKLKMIDELLHDYTIDCTDDRNRERYNERCSYGLMRSGD